MIYKSHEIVSHYKGNKIVYVVIPFNSNEKKEVFGSMKEAKKYVESLSKEK